MRKTLPLLAATLTLTACTPTQQNPTPQPTTTTTTQQQQPPLNPTANQKTVTNYLTTHHTLPDNYLQQLLPAVQKHAQLLNIEFNPQQTRQLGDIICNNTTALTTFKADYLNNTKAQQKLQKIPPETTYLDTHDLQNKFDGLGPEPHTTLPAMFITPAQCYDKFTDEDIQNYTKMTTTLINKYKDHTNEK